jgi:hypothetical protein
MGRSALALIAFAYIEWTRQPSSGSAAISRPIIDKLGAYANCACGSLVPIGTGAGAVVPLCALPLVEFVGTIDEFPDLACSLGLSDVLR